MKATHQSNQSISFLDVKELYDAAFEEKAKGDVSLARYKNLLSQAEKLDQQYRAQLTYMQSVRYRKKAS